MIVLEWDERRTEIGLVFDFFNREETFPLRMVPFDRDRIKLSVCSFKNECDIEEENEREEISMIYFSLRVIVSYDIKQHSFVPIDSVPSK